MTRTHLVTGAGGQDGILLARHLLERGDRVVGTVTALDDPRVRTHLPDVPLELLDVRATGAFAELLSRHRPDVVHNLAGLSSVGRSWDAPELTEEVNHLAAVRMLEVTTATGAAFVQASSSEIFGPPPRVAPAEQQDVEATFSERTPLNPVSPYAEAKAHAHVAVTAARDRGAPASNLILFGHTSPLHDAGFVLPTITRQAAEVALGRRTSVELRDPSIARDWGAAHDFVRAFALAGGTGEQSGHPGDYVIATGRLHRLADVAAWALTAAGVDSEVHASGEDQRPRDFGGAVGDWSRAALDLDWRPRVSLREVVEQMVRADLTRLRSGVEHAPDHLRW